MRAPLRPAIACAVILSAVAVAGQDARRAGEGPLSDEQALFEATRDNFARADREQRFFAYRERRTELRTNPFGRLGTGPTHVYEITPLTEGGFTRRLLERDGKPVPNAELERVSPRSRDRQRSGKSQLQDAIDTLEFAIDRRESSGGRSIVVVKFTPRVDAKPETRAGRLARAFAGEIRVDEDLREIMRVDATATDDIAYGYGVVARLKAGTQVTVLRQEIEPGLWFPVSLRFNGQGRALLFRKLTIDYAVDWFDYRRVATNSQPPSGQRPN